MHPNSMRLARIRAGGALALAMLATVSAVTVASQASADPGTAERPAATGLSADLLAALKRDLGLTADQAKRRVAEQARAIEADRTARARAGAAFAGSWFDTGSGKLVVAVSDARAAAKLDITGVQVRTVKHSKAHLDGIHAGLDALAGKAKGTSARAAIGKQHPSLAGLAGWHVDPKTNSVVVTAIAGQPRAKALASLEKYGDAVRVEYTSVAPQRTQFMDGGDGINFATCSAGFNLRDQSTGQGYLLTAGHCVSTGSSLFGHDGTFFGPVLESWFDVYDDAIARNDNAGYWTQGPWVDGNPSNGGFYVITGFTDAPIGTTLCKSGITTLLTCGQITVKDETVNFVTGDVVFGETRHTACVELGDSGGANFAVTSVLSAEGVTSGASLYNGRCGAAVGQPTFSWYYPIADSLGYYGPRYNVVVW
jgi:streptogrisin C